MTEHEPAIVGYEGRNVTPVSIWFIGLVEHDEFKDPYLRGRFTRQTHTEDGLHIRLFFNKHEGHEHKTEECFIEANMQEKKKPDDIESYRWTLDEDPETIYPDQIERIRELLSEFQTVGKANSGEA